MTEASTDPPSWEGRDSRDSSPISAHAGAHSAPIRNTIPSIPSLPDEAALARSRPIETGDPLVLRDDAGRFLSGTAPGPGRWPQGRREAIAVLDTMLAESGNREKLRVALQAEFDRDPMRFFRRIIMPLLPRTALLGITDGNGEPLVKIVLGVDEARL